MRITGTCKTPPTNTDVKPFENHQRPDSIKCKSICRSISYASIEERDEKAAKLIKLHEKRSWLKRKFSLVDYDRKLEIEDQIKCLNREIARI